jgi:hypothetical protein
MNAGTVGGERALNSLIFVASEAVELRARAVAAPAAITLVNLFNSRSSHPERTMLSKT